MSLQSTFSKNGSVTSSYNHICQLEPIPKCFKDGVVIPVFKGKGRDPLLTKNCRGISLTSILTKVFLSYRITLMLEDAGIPQPTQQPTDALTQYLLDWRPQLNSFPMETMFIHASIIWLVPLIQMNFVFCWKTYFTPGFEVKIGGYFLTGIVIQLVK